jgi:hypothetical protein
LEFQAKNSLATQQPNIIYDFKRRRLVSEFPKDKPKPKQVERLPSVGAAAMGHAMKAMHSSDLQIYESAPLGAMDYHPESNRIAVCRKNFVEIWDVEREAMLFKTGLESERGTAIAFSPDGRNVAVGQKSNWIQILKLPEK